MVIRLLVGCIMAFCTVLSAAEVTVHTGRAKAFVEPLMERFREATGITVTVRYGQDAALLAAIAETGRAGVPDVLWANAAATLGIASQRGLFAKLPDASTSLAHGLAPASQLWVPLSARFRCLAYATDRVKPEQLPASVLDLPRATWAKGRIGWTPGYGSFQEFITAMRSTLGEEQAKQWLSDMQALEPKVYDKNPAMLQALTAGEIDIALTNHYYIARYVRAGFPVSMHQFRVGDLGSMALVTGAGVLAGAPHEQEAQQLIAWLLSPAAQRYVADELFEVPIDPAVPIAKGVEVQAADVAARLHALHPDALVDVPGTVRVLRSLGLL